MLARRPGGEGNPATTSSTTTARDFTVIRRTIRFLAGLGTVLAALAATGCASPTSGDEGDAKPWDAPIPVADYRLSDVRCTSQPGKTNVDGEIVDDTHWLVVGTLHNELTVPSPNYTLIATVTRADGTVDDTGGSVFRSVSAAGSAEFTIVVGGEALMGSPAAECEVVVFDSVLNYAN